MSRMITFDRPNFVYRTMDVDRKSQIDDYLANLGTCFTVGGGRGIQYRGRVDRNGEFIYLYHAEKRRRRTQPAMIKGKPQYHTKVVNGATYTVADRKIISKTHWCVRVFKFPISAIKSAHQFTNHFKVVIK